MINKGYKDLTIDTLDVWRANKGTNSMLEICDFMILKYSMRDKGSDYEDYLKIQAYAEIALNTLRKLQLEEESALNEIR